MFPSPRLIMAREKLSFLMQCFADRTGGQPLIRRGGVVVYKQPADK
jgi:hypothetical protein